MVKEKWMVHSKKADFDGFAKALGVSPIVARIVRNKDLDTIEAQRAFLDNSMENLHNPSLMKDMDKAIDMYQTWSWAWSQRQAAALPLP